MTPTNFPTRLFRKYASDQQKELELLKHFKMPVFEQWVIDWDSSLKISQSTQRRKPWKTIETINEILKKRNTPAIYYFTVEPRFAEEVFKRFQLFKNSSSKVRREKGIKHAGYFSFSHVPEKFRGGNCMYAGSRREELHGRLIQHLGYANKGRTGALYLYQVVKDMKTIPKITFHYCFLPMKYRNLTKHIECVIQDKLNPFIGKRAIEQFESLDLEG